MLSSEYGYITNRDCIVVSSLLSAETVDIFIQKEDIMDIIWLIQELV